MSCQTFACQITTLLKGRRITRCLFQVPAGDQLWSRLFIIYRLVIVPCPLSIRDDLYQFTFRLLTTWSYQLSMSLFRSCTVSTSRLCLVGTIPLPRFTFSNLFHVRLVVIRICCESDVVALVAAATAAFQFDQHQRQKASSRRRRAPSPIVVRQEFERCASVLLASAFCSVQVLSMQFVDSSDDSDANGSDCIF